MNIARLRNTKAFTLIELIVVIVIMGILVAIGAFAYNAIVNSTHAKSAQLGAVQVAKTVQAASAADQAPYSDVLAYASPVWTEDASKSNLTVTTDGVNVAVSKDGYCVAFTPTATEVGTAITVPSKAGAFNSATATDGNCG